MLPLELYELIMKYLPTRQDVHNFSLVCSDFAHLVKENKWWIQLNIEYTPVQWEYENDYDNGYDKWTCDDLLIEENFDFNPNAYKIIKRIRKGYMFFHEYDEIREYVLYTQKYDYKYQYNVNNNTWTIRCGKCGSETMWPVVWRNITLIPGWKRDLEKQQDVEQHLLQFTNLEDQ